ncbi:hypothetical protein FWH30_01500 [Microgenomates group bacterium]|nr:hypothetical protein [Microgenomates group bacterium]
MQEETTIKTADDIVNEALGNSGGGEMDEVAKSDQLAQTLSSLQGIIERNALQLQQVDGELKEKRQMLKNIFDNDTALTVAQEEAKQATQKQRERKVQLQNDGQAVSLKLQIAEINQQKREIQEALSSHLVNYHQLTGATSFDTSDGDQWDFDIWAKVKVKK